MKLPTSKCPGENEEYPKFMNCNKEQATLENHVEPAWFKEYEESCAEFYLKQDIIRWRTWINMWGFKIMVKEQQLEARTVVEACDITPDIHIIYNKHQDITQIHLLWLWLFHQKKCWFLYVCVQIERAVAPWVVRITLKCGTTMLIISSIWPSPLTHLVVYSF